MRANHATEAPREDQASPPKISDVHLSDLHEARSHVEGPAPGHVWGSLLHSLTFVARATRLAFGTKD